MAQDGGGGGGGGGSSGAAAVGGWVCACVRACERERDRQTELYYYL